MKARILILAIIAALAAGVGNGLGATNEVSGLLQKGLFEEEANHDLDAAIRAYQAVVTQTDKDHQFAATAIFRLGECYRKQGKTNEANAEYQRILREFSDQTELVKLSQQYVKGTEPGPAPDASFEERLTYFNRMSKENQGNTEIQRLRALLADSPDRINARDSEGRTPLLNAVQANLIKVAAFLLDNKADTEIRDNFARTPLIMAAEKGRKDMLELLLDRGADVNAAVRRDKVASHTMISTDEDGRTALHYAALYGYGAIAESLLAHGTDVNARTAQGKTALDYAAEKGFKAVAETLLAHGANVNSQDDMGRTALFAAVSGANKAMVELLLAKGADVNAKAKDGGTVLSWAIGGGNKSILELLLANKADVNARDNYGRTALFFAVGAENKSMTESLLSGGADVNMVARDGKSALFLAVENGNAAMVEILLANKADPNLKAPDGLTALIDAVNCKRPEIVKLLLEHGADVNSQMADNQSSTPRWTALDAAVSLNDSDMVKLLLEHHADPNAKFDRANNRKIDLRDETPLMMAAANDAKDIAKILLANNADVNARDSRGQTALWRACSWRQNKDMTELLLENKADTEIKYNNGRTVLAWCMASYSLPNMEFARLFLAHGANVNARDEAGMAPLHLAVGANSQPMVELLLEHGAEVNARDKNGKTPLDLWLNRGNGQPMFTIQPEESGSGSAPLFYQWHFQGAEDTGGKDIGIILREHGGIADADIATIRVMRSGQLSPQVVFHRDTGEHNHFTLYEVLAGLYTMQSYCELQSGDQHLWRGAWFSFPDLGRLKVVHLAEKGRSKADIVNVEKSLGSGDCSANVPLKWGDIIDLPEMDHNVSEIWQGPTQPQINTLETCLKRHIKIIVKGTETAFTLTPPEEIWSSVSPNYHRPQREIVASKSEIQSFWLSQVVSGSHLVLASSDLTRVKVKRPGAGKTSEMVVNLEKMGPHSDLWLEDGDLIEIPEKTSE